MDCHKQRIWFKPFSVIKNLNKIITIQLRSFKALLHVDQDKSINISKQFEQKFPNNVMLVYHGDANELYEF